MNLCKYKNVFGIPGKGIHYYRFMNTAIADVIMRLVASYFISYYFKN